ncbi:MAG: DUF192 domain-containing protein [Bdellovibrionaceae bacterium]|nr:DUF192 domain-containing protein [Pseudobdellovibrionaceae bacterium]
MMRLVTKSGNKTLIPHLEVADTLWTRTKGLLGRESLPAGNALWILRCNSVHTFFMNFAIDLVFVDRQLVVKKTLSRVKPWSLVLPVWRATSVIELSEGFLENNPIRVGEQLHVDHTLS